MISHWIKIFAIFLLLLVLLTGCDLVLGFFQPLLGTWESPEFELSFRIIGFEKKQVTSAGYVSYRGDYICHGNNLTLCYDMGGESEFAYEIRDNKLYLSDSQGQSYFFKKK